MSCHVLSQVMFCALSHPRLLNHDLTCGCEARYDILRPFTSYDSAHHEHEVGVKPPCATLYSKTWCCTLCHLAPFIALTGSAPHSIPPFNPSIHSLFRSLYNQDGTLCDTASIPLGGRGYIGAYSPEARRERIERFLAKRDKRVWTKKVKYDVRKNFADSRLRVKVRHTCMCVCMCKCVQLSAW